MAQLVMARQAIITEVTGTLQEGFCEQCGTQTVKEFYMDGERRRVHMVCPKCGGSGKLIVRTYSIQPPKPPKCINPKCLYKFFLRVIFCSLLSTYHNKRVNYAQRNKYKNIQGKYRTGEPSPATIKQCLGEIFKMSLRR